MDTIIENLPAQKAGLLKGDRVLSINGIEITNWADMSDLVKKNPGNEIIIQVARAGAVETFNLTPTENGTIGINNFGTEYQNAYKEVKYSFFESLGGGINYGYNILTESQASVDFIVSTIGGTATAANTPNTVVKRNGDGDFAAGVITADLILLEYLDCLKLNQLLLAASRLAPVLEQRLVLLLLI